MLLTSQAKGLLALQRQARARLKLEGKWLSPAPPKSMTPEGELYRKRRREARRLGLSDAEFADSYMAEIQKKPPVAPSTGFMGWLFGR